MVRPTGGWRAGRPARSASRPPRRSSRHPSRSLGDPMLTLTNALTISGCTVYQDDTNQLATFEQAIADRPTWKINDDGTVSAVPGHGLTDTTTTPRPKYYLLPETP